MLHELLNEANYNSTCDASVQQIVHCYFGLNQKYIDEFVQHESMCKDDFYTGCVILRHVFNVLLSSTMNLGLTHNICIITIMYYIEFVSQIHSSRYTPTGAMYDGPFSNGGSDGGTEAGTHGERMRLRQAALLFTSINTRVQNVGSSSLPAPSAQTTLGDPKPPSPPVTGGSANEVPQGESALPPGCPWFDPAASGGLPPPAASGSPSSLPPAGPAVPSTPAGRAVDYVITHRDITLFVYNKTLSNLNRHFSKSNRSAEKKLARTEYYVRMYMLVVRHVLVPSSGIRAMEKDAQAGAGTETEMTQAEKKGLPKVGEKITDIFKQCLSTHIHCQHLQCLLILLEYISLYSSRSSLKYIRVIVRLFSAFVQRGSEDACVTPKEAMARASSAEFMYNVRSLTPHAFLKWFVSCDIS